MRDLLLLAFTLLAMRQLCCDRAHLVRDGRASPTWYAGWQPLNTQAVQDLLNHGWLRRAEDGRSEVRIDAWPSFATQELQGAEFARTSTSKGLS